MANTRINILEGPILKNALRFTVPIILTSILQLLFNAADLIVVGRFCGSLSVAAVGATGTLTALMVNFFIGLSVGTGVSVARSIGAGQDERICRAVHTAILTSVICGAFLTVLGMRFNRNFLIMMSTPDDVLNLSSLYMRIYFGGITFAMLYNFCAAILRASGNTKAPLIYLTVSGIINVVLNVIFVTAFDMNVAGVALATAISQAVAAILCVIRLMREESACRLIISKLRIYKAEFLEILRIGLPAGIQNSLFSISNVIIQSSLNTFGAVFLSGSAAASNLEGFAYVTMNAFSQTSMTFVGQNAGAKQYDRVKRITVTCLLCVIAAGILSGGLLFIFGKTLLSIYITDSPQAIAYGLIRITWVCIPYFLCGTMETATGALRGLGSSVAPMIISVAGVCGIRLFWVFTIFPIERFHTPESLFFSYTVSWIVTLLSELVLFVFIYRKKRMNDLQI